LVAEIGSATGMLMLAASIFLFTAKTPTPGLLTLIPTIGTCLMILWATPTTLIGRLLGTRLLVGVGLLSYSAYLWHQPLFVFARYAGLGKPTSAVMLGLSLLAVVLAYATWQFVERPFRDRKIVNRKKLVGTLLVATIVLTSFGIAGTASSGFRDLKVTARDAKILASAVPSPLRDSCHYRDAARHPLVPCEYNLLPATWAVLGDSHAVELSFALANLLQSRGLGLIHYSHSDCAPLQSANNQDEECQEWTSSAIHSITDNPKVTTVVLSYRMNYYLFGGHEDVYPNQPNEYSNLIRTQRWDGFRNAVNSLVASGKHVVYVLQAPELPASIEYMTLVTGVSPIGDVKGVSRKWWKERTRYLMGRLHDLPDSVIVVDPANRFCDDETCYAARNDTALYFDDDHMSVAGASLVAREITASIDSATNNAMK
jgi:hypothetical protein